MILILEGPDGAGKTTLANKLSQQTGYPIIHRGVPKDEKEKKNMMKQYRELIQEKSDVILDRCWYSELVYGHVMRDSSVLTIHEMYELEEMLSCIGCLLIFCSNDVDILWNACQQKGENYIVHRKDFEEICRIYEHIMNVIQHIIPVVHYRYQTETTEPRSILQGDFYGAKYKEMH